MQQTEHAFTKREFGTSALGAKALHELRGPAQMPAHSHAYLPCNCRTCSLSTDYGMHANMFCLCERSGTLLTINSQIFIISHAWPTIAQMPANSKRMLMWHFLNTTAESTKGWGAIPLAGWGRPSNIDPVPLMKATCFCSTAIVYSVNWQPTAMHENTLLTFPWIT